MGIVGSVNVRRVVLLVVLLAGVAVALALVLSTNGNGYKFSVVTRSATNVAVGQDVRAAGRPVGRVSALEPVEGGRAARVEVEIDDSAGPFPQGTRLALRWGGSISFSNRYLAVMPGPADAPPIPDGGEIPSSDLRVPVELDQVLGTFDKDARRGLKRLIDAGGPAFSRLRPEFGRALDEPAPEAAGELHAVLRDLDADRKALAALVRSTAAVVDAVDRAEPGAGELVSGAGQTFDAVADESRGLEETLRGASGTLATARTTLGRADRTLRSADQVLTRLGPGVDRLREIIPPLTEVLGTVQDVGPSARKTLATAERATPDVIPLLGKARPLMPRLRSIGEQLDEQLNCIRPYTPEIAAFFSNWGDFLNSSDGTDRIHRGAVEFALQLPHNLQFVSSEKLVNSIPGLRYFFPMPPGYLAGQPWFIPECGVGPEALDPSQDPEARPFDPLKLNPTGPPGGDGR